MLDVTVIVAAYNVAETLGRAIESAVAQSGVRLEVIVVEDHSIDDTLSIATSYAERFPNVKVLRTPYNAGPSYARNLGIRNSRSEWIAILDGDDEFKANRLAKMKAVASSLESDVLFDNMSVVEKGSEEQFLQTSRTQVLSLEIFVKNNFPFITRKPFGYLKPLFRRSFLIKNGIFYNERLRNSEDYMIVLEAMIHGAKVHLTPDAGYRYYVYNNSISARPNHGHTLHLIAAEREYLVRYSDKLSPRETAIILRHIRNRTLTIPIYNAIEALKNRDALSLGKTFLDLNVLDFLYVAYILLVNLCRRLSRPKSRF